MLITIVIIANFVVGILLGLTSIAGFLLPMLYVSLSYSVQESLALSFTAFCISGILGSYNYYKKGQLRIRYGIQLGLASAVGAVIGVYLNSFIDDSIVKILLYSVVLFSGISILFRKDKEHTVSKTPSLWITLLLGFTTAIVCALSGAGGPILVMPLLVVFGFKIREAIALALFDSIFIAIPSSIGYFMQCNIQDIWVVLIAASIAHGIGVYFGSRHSEHVPQALIKKVVAVSSICIAIWKLFG